MSSGWPLRALPSKWIMEWAEAVLVACSTFLMLTRRMSAYLEGRQVPMGHEGGVRWGV
jgi:hypothetical protein